MTSVITGDIVKSQEVDSVEDIINILITCFASLNLKESDWTIYRGDSFQVEVCDVEKSLEYAIYIKAYIKFLGNLEVRMAIGIGDKTYNGKNVALSTGSAFVNSGETLETLKSDKLNLKLKTDDPKLDEELNLYIRLGLIAMDNWTQSSAEIVKLYFENPAMLQKDVALILNISQNAVSKRQKRAHLDEIIQLNLMYKKKIKELN